MCFLIVCCVLIVACDQTKYSKEISQIESMENRLDSVEKILLNIDTLGFTEAGQKFFDNLNFVQQAYTETSDTMPRDVAMLMSDYRSLKKPSKGFMSRFFSVNEELKFSKEQLRDLKEDLEHNRMEAELVKKSLQDESLAVENVISDIEGLRLSAEYTRENRARLEPRIDSLIQVIKTKGI